MTSGLSVRLSPSRASESTADMRVFSLELDNMLVRSAMRSPANTGVRIVTIATAIMTTSPHSRFPRRMLEPRLDGGTANEVNVFWVTTRARFAHRRCMLEAMSDQQYRLGVLAGAVALVSVITYLRFCGSVGLPAKPPPPAGPSGTQTELLSKSASSPTVYTGFLASDASAAGVRTPTLTEMSRKLPYRVDEARHVLEPGNPPIDVAGLRLRLERSSDQVVMVIENLLESDAAYEVTSMPSGGAGCNAARPLPFNAMVIRKGGSERRTECTWRDGMSIIVTKVETIEVLPLSAWYLSQLPPQVVGIEERIARGHHGVDSKEKCSAVVSQVVRTGFDRGEIGWRDLVDFYSRHRCQTYQFPSSYRALRADGERAVPAGG